MVSTQDQDRIDYLVSGLKEFGITQKRFAAQLGVTPETVSRWCNGKLDIPSYAMGRLTLLYVMQLAIDTLREGITHLDSPL